MNILDLLAVSEVCEIGWEDEPDHKISDAELRRQYPTLKDAWETHKDALSKYNTLLQLIRATNP